MLVRLIQADGDTALYVAAKAGHDEAVRALLEVSTTKVNWQNRKGECISSRLLRSQDKLHLVLFRASLTHYMYVGYDHIVPSRKPTFFFLEAFCSNA